ncbi:condensation domain-containing protein [Nocardia neocaledoniensis]|uniref:condensation domain-containing protein n=1 Tax=Nocardia neocaledoniensis TaxID=236511 RepID=UPI00245686C6|nr:condensation domain-containing protein [Nocardia neocaledoniensis]
MFDPGSGMRSGGYDAARGVLTAHSRSGTEPACFRPPTPPVVVLAPRPRPARVPLAPAQERMWHAARLGRSADWNVASAMRLRGAEVDATALRAALALLVERHEPLRTRYPATEQGPVQRVAAMADVDLDVTEKVCTASDLGAAVAEIAARPFDLAQDLPLRAGLFVLGPGDVVLTLVVHHISVDGRSMGPLVRDLVTAYLACRAGTAPRWAPLPVTYTDYTLWKHDQLGEFTDEWSRATHQLRYWANALAGRPALLDLPTRHHVSPPPDPAAGALVPVAFDARTHAGLLLLAQQRRASLFMVLQAAFALAVGAFARSADVTVATAVPGRDHRLLDDLVGNFSDDVLLRVRLDRAGDVDELVDQVRRVALAAYAHPDTPAPRLKRCLLQDAALPLFQATLILQRARASHPEPAAAPGLSITEVPTGVVRAKHDLEFGLTDRYDPAGAPAGIDGSFRYPIARFDDDTARRFVDRFTAIARLLAEGYRGPLPALLAATSDRSPVATARRAARVLV